MNRYEWRWSNSEAKRVAMATRASLGDGATKTAIENGIEKLGSETGSDRVNADSFAETIKKLGTQSRSGVRQKTGAGKNFFLTTVDSEDVGLFAFTVVVTVAYMSVAAAFYAVLLGWDYWQAFYFSFQSMALIGFGDQYPELEDPSFIMWHMAITTMGIILLAVCFFIVRDWWSKVVSAVTVAVALKFNITVPQEVALNSEDDTLREAGGLDLEEVNKSILSGSA